MEKKSSPIVVLGPMECESSELIAALDGCREKRVGSYVFSEGVIDSRPVVVVRCLIGMVNSATVATIAAMRYAPSCMIIQGTAGAHNPELHRNDLVLGEKILELGSYYTSPRSAGEGISEGDRTYPGAEMLVNGRVERVRVLKSDPCLLEIAESVPYPYGVRVHGTIGSSDVWNKERAQILFYHESFQTDCEEMEAFAVSQVCFQFGIPVLNLRIISNSELYPDEEFSEQAGVFCQRYVLDVIREMIRREKE